MMWCYYDRKVYILFVILLCFVCDSCCFYYDKLLIMFLFEVLMEREIDEVDLDSDGYWGLRIFLRLNDFWIKVNKFKWKRIYIVDKVEKNQLLLDNDIVVGQNRIENILNFLEKVIDLNGIKQCGSIKEVYVNIKCIGG